MQISIILTTLLNTFATSPNLCAEVYLDANGDRITDAAGQTFSRYCEWTGPASPVLDADVCCVFDGDDASCTPPDRYGRCRVGSKMYCEYGEVTRAGVLCYQPFPSICDFGYCAGDVAPPDSGGLEGGLCCWGNGTCTELETSADSVACVDNGGYAGYCIDGVQNEDGTTTCFDY
jgi:hypothetical protein